MWAARGETPTLISVVGEKRRWRGYRAKEKNEKGEEGLRKYLHAHQRGGG